MIRRSFKDLKLSRRRAYSKTADEGRIDFILLVVLRLLAEYLYSYMKKILMIFTSMFKYFRHFITDK